MMYTFGWSLLSVLLRQIIIRGLFWNDVPHLCYCSTEECDSDDIIDAGCGRAKKKLKFRLVNGQLWHMYVVVLGEQYSVQLFL